MHTDSLSDEAPRSPALLALFVFAGVTTLVAWLGSVATTESVNSHWFESLEKLAFYPPDAVFGIVWTILYVLIALSGWLAWRHGGGADVIVPWSLQIALNLDRGCDVGSQPRRQPALRALHPLGGLRRGPQLVDRRPELISGADDAAAAATRIRAG